MMALETLLEPAYEGRKLRQVKRIHKHVSAALAELVATTDEWLAEYPGRGNPNELVSFGA